MNLASADSSANSIDERTFGSFRRILLLSGPLIFSHMGVMLMQIVDGLFLARYSKETIAALGPAGMTFWLLCGFFIGIAGYTNTFVAQYVGARRPERVGAAVWQGIYLSLIAGVILALASFVADPLFTAARHAPDIRQHEITYFTILCYGGVFTVMSAALSGFFAGRSDNVRLMAAHVCGNVVNALLAWVLVFGVGPFPEMGMAGAAWAAVIGQGTQVLILAFMLLRPQFAREYHTWRDRRVDYALLRRMCIHGFPNGLRYILEILAWDVFMFVMGQISSDGLSATNIVFRINGVAFFPVVGLATAVSMLVGQAQGAGRPDLSRMVTRRGMVLAEIWMVSAAALMVLTPRLLLDPFFSEPMDAGSVSVHALSIKLLWFVAAYCIADGINIVLMSMLQGCGDTRWLLFASGAIHIFFLTLLVSLAWVGVGVFGVWAAATIFICCAALMFGSRYLSKQWEHKRVIEHPSTEAADAPNAVTPL